MEIINLSKNEREVMGIFWANDEALSPADLVDRAKNSSWKANSIYQLVNSLLEKGAIVYDHSEKGKRNRISFYKATVSLESYTAQEFVKNQKHRQRIPTLISALVNEIDNLEDIEALEKIICSKKENLK